MRVVAVAVAAIAILIMGLTLQTVPSATAGLTAGVQVDPYALHLAIDPRALPEQPLGDLI